jgi:serine/threonine protein kinase
MAWVAINCPQCSAPLPRVAIWRTVKCGSCGSLITKTESVVMRDTFRKALERARGNHTGGGKSIECGGHGYQLLQRLGDGEISQVHLARRIGTMPLLVTLKLSSASSAKARYVREAQVLRELNGRQDDPVGVYLSQVLPEVVSYGAVDGGSDRHALVLGHSTGYWGSLEALGGRFPQGIDQRHAVWIWRRMLGILSLVHSRGWAHGDVRPEHALVHPRDHGVRLISWAAAQKDAGADAQATDLMRSARVIWMLLNRTDDADQVQGTVPAGLAHLVTEAGRDPEFCRLNGASGLDSLLREASRVAFGPPSFVPLSV